MKVVSADELAAWMVNDTMHLLVDVREAFEREYFNIGGLHIPLGEMMAFRDKLPRDIPVVFYCEKGIRSQIAIQRLEAHGFENLFNLSGGMKDWRTKQAKP